MRLNKKIKFIKENAIFINLIIQIIQNNINIFFIINL
jgi:hypothetical protein